MDEAIILIIEDDEDIREGVRILLEGENYNVQEAESGEKGLAILNGTVDLVILDIMMPGMSGLRTCEEIRKRSNVPVLFLTAKTQESDKLIGLMAGGDDYLAKPFSYTELLGRVKALLRRYRIYKGKPDIFCDLDDADYIRCGDIRVHKVFNEVYVRGYQKNVSDMEYQILREMIRHPNKVFSAQLLYETVWKEPYIYSSNSTIMVHIRRLRVKIEDDPQNPVYIKTVWGKGYKFVGNEKA